MNHEIFLEIGQKKVLAGATDWPGWCRGGRSEEAAVQALVDYGPRYAAVMAAAGLEVTPPAGAAGFSVVERAAGNASTDYGVPDQPLASDARPLEEAELARLQTILSACWQAFDRALAAVEGVELRRGPRGGGRQPDAMARHVLESNVSYLGRLDWRLTLDERAGVSEQIEGSRLATLDALARAARGQVPALGPRGGKRWTPRYFARRAAWHVLDHLWEIEDRSL